MAIKLKDVIESIITKEAKEYSDEDIKAISEEFKNLTSNGGNKQHEDELQKQLEEVNKKYDDLKSRVVEGLLGGSKDDNSDDDSNDSHDNSDDSKNDEEEKTFKDLISTDYQD